MSASADVIVVGSGPGGAATAYFLTRAGVDVVLVDKDEFPRDKTCGDGLTRGALRILSEMGLLEDLVSAGFPLCGLDIHALERYTVRFPFPRSGEIPAALVVPRKVLDELVRRRAVASGARFVRGRVDTIDVQPNGIEVSTTDGGSSFRIRSKAAVVATGANLKLLVRLGLRGKDAGFGVATRAYYSGVEGLSFHAQAFFGQCGVPLPGYGWVFPTSASTANVGAGRWYPGRTSSGSNRSHFRRFVTTGPLGEMLSRAKQEGPVKGYPLLVDFASAPTFAERILLVGESAGLVNPMTGEGVDLALESGQLAAAHLEQAFQRGDFSRARFSQYDELLRKRYQSVFVGLRLCQQLCAKRSVVARLAERLTRQAALRALVAEVILGSKNLAVVTQLARQMSVRR